MRKAEHGHDFIVKIQHVHADSGTDNKRVASTRLLCSHQQISGRCICVCVGVQVLATRQRYPWHPVPSPDQSFSYPRNPAYQSISIKQAAFVQTMISRSWPFEFFPLSLPSSVTSGVRWYLEQIHLGGPLETFTFSTSAAQLRPI